MSRPLRAFLLAALASAAAACGASRAPLRSPASAELVVPADPAALMESIREEAASRRAFVARETCDTITVDWGLRPCLLETGPEDPAPRPSEMHVETTYRVRPAPDGAVLTVEQETLWWHPDRRVWVRLDGRGRRDAAAEIPATAAAELSGVR